MSQAERDAWNRMLATLVTGAGVGAGLRGIMGLRNFMRNKPEVDVQSSIPQAIPIPIPRPDPLKLRLEEQRQKQSSPVMGARPDGGLNYWEWPVGVAAAGGGLAGGWKLVDWLMNKRRKASISGELDKAKSEYDQALSDQYEAAMLGKGASASPTLDAVYDHLSDPSRCQAHLEKLGFNSLVPESWKTTGRNIGHGAAGAYLTALMAITGLSGLGAYKWTKSKGQGKAMERAIQRRRAMRSEPQPILAVPQYADEMEV